MRNGKRLQKINCTQVPFFCLDEKTRNYSTVSNEFPNPYLNNLIKKTWRSIYTLNHRQTTFFKWTPIIVNRVKIDSTVVKEIMFSNGNPSSMWSTVRQEWGSETSFGSSPHNSKVVRSTKGRKRLILSTSVLRSETVRSTRGSVLSRSWRSKDGGSSVEA